jgi:hypothetical protein
MKTLFDPAAYEEITRRVESLQPGSPRQWGKMTVSQMLEHSARALEIAAGKKRTKQAFVGIAIGWIFKGNFVGEKPFGRNGPTGPEFIVSNEPDFQRSRERVTALLKELHQLGERAAKEPSTGKLTGAEWGITRKAAAMDHHLRQFGVTCRTHASLSVFSQRCRRTAQIGRRSVGLRPRAVGLSPSRSLENDAAASSAEALPPGRRHGSNRDAAAAFPGRDDHCWARSPPAAATTRSARVRIASDTRI